MIRPEVLQEIERAADEDVVTLVLQWDGMPDLDDLQQLQTMEARRSVVQDYFRRRKATLLNWLQERIKAEINDLESLGNAIVTARKRDWNEMIQAPNSPLHDPDVVVLPNLRVYPD